MKELSTISTNLPLLTSSVSLLDCSRLPEILAQKGCITEVQRRHVESEGEQWNKAMELMDIMRRRSRAHWKLFIGGLRETEQNKLAVLLEKHGG